MFFSDLLFLSYLINFDYYLLNKSEQYQNEPTYTQQHNKNSNNIESDKIGIIDFRFILKRSSMG